MSKSALWLVFSLALGGLARGDAPIVPQGDDVPPPPKLGITFFPADIADAGGILVVDVVPGFPAAAAGLLAGDVLVAIDGRTPPQDGDLLKQLSAFAPGAVVPVEVLREDRRLDLKLVLTTPDAAAMAALREAAVRLQKTAADRARSGRLGSPESRPVLRGWRVAEPASRTLESRNEKLAMAERALAGARRIISVERPSSADLAEARRLIVEAESLLAAGRAAATPVRPKTVLERAHELSAAGRHPEEIERMLKDEFGLSVVIADETSASRPARALLRGAAPESRSSSRSTSRETAPPK